MSLIESTLKESLTRLASEENIELKDIRIKIESSEIEPVYTLMNKTVCSKSLTLKRILNIGSFDILGKERIVRNYLIDKLMDLDAKLENANIRVYMKSENIPSFYIFDGSKAMYGVEVDEL